MVPRAKWRRVERGRFAILSCAFRRSITAYWDRVTMRVPRENSDRKLGTIISPELLSLFMTDGK